MQLKGSESSLLLTHVATRRHPTVGMSQVVKRPAKPGSVTPTTQECVFFRTVPSDVAASNPEAAPVPHVVYPEVSNTGYGIKHIKDKPSLGLAMSGGGFRAATCAAGWTRGLNKLTVNDKETGKDVSVLSKAKYIATTSGGSWFNAALSYSGPLEPQIPLDEFLGELEQASQLTPEVLATPPKGSFDSLLSRRLMLDDFVWGMLEKYEAVAHAHKAIKTVVERRLDDLLHQRDQQQEPATQEPDWVSVWTRAVTESFLKPYGLNIYRNSTLTAAGTTGAIDERAHAMAEYVLTACGDPDRPYPIFMGSAFNTPGGDGYKMYPYEFTPLYYGTPGAFPKSAPPLGGGYTEPWGLNARPVSACMDGKGQGCSSGAITVDRRGSNPRSGHSLHMVPLAEAVSISSSFLAASACQLNGTVQKMASTEELINWGLMAGQEGGLPDSSSVSFADGGTIDNLGISALLRRGVRCMIVFAASSSAPDDTWETFAKEANDVACWFGAARGCFTPGMTATELNDISQVFGKNKREGEELFRDLFDDIHRKLRAGKPGFHRAHYRVHENHYHNIPASKEGEDVEVLWIFNHQWADWEDQLPVETKARLEHDRKGQGIHHRGVMKREILEGELKAHGGFLQQHNLTRFPYVTTFSLDFSSEIVHMLGQLSSAVVMHPEVQQHIRNLLDIASRM